jgi:hypothetical protein
MAFTCPFVTQVSARGVLLNSATAPEPMTASAANTTIPPSDLPAVNTEYITAVSPLVTLS